jgi:hypothetical protein
VYAMTLLPGRAPTTRGLFPAALCPA